VRASRHDRDWPAVPPPALAFFATLARPRFERTLAAAFGLAGSWATQPGGAVLDGRDIGTVIAPDADVKLFVTASLDARALRRWKEMQARGDRRSLEEITADLRRRDERDRNRAEAPLREAEDAVVLDTSAMGVDEAIAAAIAAVERLR
jgi:cytidylate kinase